MRDILQVHNPSFRVFMHVWISLHITCIEWHTQKETGITKPFL